MKKLMFFGAMLALGTGAASAQAVQQDKGKTNQATTKQYDKQSVASAAPQEVAEFLTAFMADKLSLTAEQSAKVKEINAARLAELQNLWQNNQGPTNKGELKGLEKRYNADLKATLTPKQYAQYEAFVAKYKD
jgi:protein CpxP